MSWDRAWFYLVMYQLLLIPLLQANQRAVKPFLLFMSWKVRFFLFGFGDDKQPELTEAQSMHTHPDPIRQQQRHPEPAALFWLINKIQLGPGRSDPWTPRWLHALLVAQGGQYVGKRNRSVEPGTEFKPCI